MKYLSELEFKIAIVDGMLVETSGKFGMSGLQNYINDCFEIARLYFNDTHDKMQLLALVDWYINQYKEDVSWKYYDYEMQFLISLKNRIVEL